MPGVKRACPLVLSLPLLLLLAGQARPDSRGEQFFEAKIRPALVAHCFECHSASAAKVRGGLLLDSREGLRNGGDGGAVIVPGDPGKSRLIQALNHAGLKMPKKKLPEQVIADFTAWVKMGAPDPRSGGKSVAYKRMTAEEARRFWAYQPLAAVKAPPVKNTTWARSDIDRFVLARLEGKGLAPASDADRRTLIRRLSFDLVGLPPTPEEVAAFLDDRSDSALDKVVDRLLASPHFGERWGRHWLDLARYADSNGNADNAPFPHAWRYRNYVIDAFSKDRPYDRFITEQVAGDLLQADSPAEKDELLIATGFLALTSKPRAQNNPNYLMDLVADQVDVTSRAVLGLTVMCARCHDHKFDTISQKEYYALAGFFESTQLLAGPAARGGGKKAGGVAGLHSLSSNGQAMGVREGRPTDSYVCVRGESRQRGARVPRGFLAVATPGKAPAVPSARSGRLELAQWLTHRDNPLPARVAVNRIWQHLFGRGLVASVDNFGALGERPTHPELLDWLASRFIQDGWSHKKTIKLIVTSRTYQQSSDHHAGHFKADPDNRLVWRMSSRRLEGEAIRDAILAVSGRLEHKPPTGSPVAAAPARGKRGGIAVKDSNHRSVYLPVPRGTPGPEILGIFDAANPNLLVAQREVTTVPAQALFLMNSPFVREQAGHMAKRLLAAPSLDDAGRADLAYRLALARPATARERDRAVGYVQGPAGTSQKEDATRAWAQFCQALLASAEFRYLD
jgi:hypothetical protein